MARIRRKIIALSDCGGSQSPFAITGLGGRTLCVSEKEHRASRVERVQVCSIGNREFHSRKPWITDSVTEHPPAWRMVDVTSSVVETSVSLRHIHSLPNMLMAFLGMATANADQKIHDFTAST